MVGLIFIGKKIEHKVESTFSPFFQPFFLRIIEERWKLFEKLKIWYAGIWQIEIGISLSSFTY